LTAESSTVSSSSSLILGSLIQQNNPSLHKASSSPQINGSSSSRARGSHRWDESELASLNSPLRKAQSQGLLWMPQFDAMARADFASAAGSFDLNGQCTHGPMMEDYVTVKLLTATPGGCCTVELCKQLSTQTDVVIKIFNRGLLEKKARRSLSKTANNVLQVALREIAIMQKLRHPNIVHQLDMIDSADGMLYIVMEYVIGGPTMRWNEAEWKYDATESHNCDALTPDLARTYFRDAILGLEYIHAQSIVHRDIKPENLLVDHLFVPGSVSSGLAPRVKIADFGVSCFVSVGDDQISDTQGTLLFEAPESFSGQPYSGFQSDVWALGVTLYCFLYQNVPFEADTLAELNNIINTTIPVLPDDVDPELAHLFALILNKDGSKRITIQELKQHPWVVDGTGAKELTSPVPLQQISVTEEEVITALTPNTRPPLNYIAMITKIKVQMRKLKETAMTPKSKRLVVVPQLDGFSENLPCGFGDNIVLGEPSVNENASSAYDVPSEQM